MFECKLANDDHHLANDDDYYDDRCSCLYVTDNKTIIIIIVLVVVVGTPSLRLVCTYIHTMGERIILVYGEANEFALEKKK